MELKEIYINIVHVSSILGIVLTTFFLIILYVTRKSSVEGFSLALAQNCVVDLLFALITAVVRMDAAMVDGFAVYAITTFSFQVDAFIVKFLLTLAMIPIHLSFFCLAIPFIVRYCIISRGGTISCRTVIKFYCAPLVAVVISITLFNLAFKVSPDELQNMQMKTFVYPKPEGKYWNFVAAKMLHPITAFLFVFVLVILVINYILAIYFNYKVLQYLKQRIFTEKERKSIYDLQKIMIIQAIAQFCTIVVPLTLIVGCSFFGFKDTVYILGILEMAPAITTTCTFLSIPNCKEKVAKTIHLIRDDFE